MSKNQLTTDYTIFVVHCRQHRDAQYIGRPSPLRNRFPIDATHTRGDVIRLHAEEFHQQIQDNDPKIIAALVRLHRLGKKHNYIKLGCFCRPRYACHGDTIKTFMDTNRELLEMWELEAI